MDNKCLDPKIFTTLDLLKLLVYLEAQGEPFEGKLAVACIVKNRTKDKRWPNTYKEVMLQPSQFSCFNNMNEDRYKLFRKPMVHDLEIIQRECRAASFLVHEGWVRDVTNGANHYYNPEKCAPSWAEGVNYKTIGQHRFLKL